MCILSNLCADPYAEIPPVLKVIINTISSSEYIDSATSAGRFFVERTLRRLPYANNHTANLTILIYSEEVIRIAVAPQITEDKYFGENGAGIPIWRQIHFPPKGSCP
jgi:hypothetical protein